MGRGGGIEVSAMHVYVSSTRGSGIVSRDECGAWDERSWWSV